MLPSRIPFIVLVAGLCAVPLGAQEARVISLEDALRMFAEDNLELRLSRSRADQAAGLARQAGAFPNPSLGATHEPLSGGGRSYSETYLTASQRFEISGSRGARTEEGARRRDAAVERIRADSIRLAFDVKSAYVLALHAQDRRSVTQRITEVFREATRAASERYEAGDISLYARNRIRVERARYETLLADADMEVGAAQRKLALLVAPSGQDVRFAAVPLPTPTPPSIPTRTFDLAVVEARPELASARAEVDAEVARARLMRAERVPDLTASGGFKRQSDGLRGVFLGLSIPVPFFDRGAGAVQAADAGLLAAEERLMLTRRQLENDVLQAVESFETLQRRSQLLSGEVMGEGDDLLDIALVAYEQGEMELVELLDAAAALHGARTAESGLQASLWTAYYNLERAVGGFDNTSAQSMTEPEIR